jgi:Beta protein
MAIVYSDYASVHPIRYPTPDGSWVPRIDVFQNGQFAFSRLRNQDGGYAAAAKIIVRNCGSTLPNCWGSDQIKQAASGTLPGKSPSFWISARINMWITQRTTELSS